MTTAAGADRRVANCKALVLGARGFLGTHITTALREDGVSVTTATRGLATGADAISLNPVQDDLSRLQNALALVQPDVVVNCVGRIDGEPAELAELNIVLPARITHAVAAVVPHARLIHLGSAGEYGIPAESGRPIDEDAQEQPVSNYGITKLAGTRLMLALAADHGVDVAVLRIFNPVGPGNPAGTLPGRSARVLRAAIRNEPHQPIEMAPLDAYRDFVDVRDIAAAVLAAARVPALSHQLYNVASGQAACVRDVVTLLAAEAGYRGEISERRAQTDRSLGVSWQQADISRARSDLGWVPRHELASSVKELWKWVG